jgi:hypothetical protein
VPLASPLPPRRIGAAAGMIETSIALRRFNHQIFLHRFD